MKKKTIHREKHAIEEHNSEMYPEKWNIMGIVYVEI